MIHMSKLNFSLNRANITYKQLLLLESYCTVIGFSRPRAFYPLLEERRFEDFSALLLR